MSWIRHHPAARVHTVLERLENVFNASRSFITPTRCRDQANTQNGSLSRQIYHVYNSRKKCQYIFFFLFQGNEHDHINLKKLKQVTIQLQRIHGSRGGELHCN